MKGVEINFPPFQASEVSIARLERCQGSSPNMAIDFALIRIKGQRAIEGQRSKSEGQRAPTGREGVAPY